jgi:hypothetical protein
MNAIFRQHLFAAALASILAVTLLCPLAAWAQDDTPIGNEYRVTVFPNYRITDTATGFGYLGMSPIRRSNTRPTISARV